MKYIKMLGLLAVAAAALMAFAGSASASTLTSGGATYTGEIVATSTNSKLDGSFITVECSHSEAKGKVEKHGAVDAGGKLTTLTFTGCNYNVTTTTLEEKYGDITITAGKTVISNGAKIHVHTSVGLCTFVTSNTTVGTLTQSSETGGNAVMDINSAKIPRTEGNFLCGTSGTWTGNYTVTTPANLNVH